MPSRERAKRENTIDIVQYANILAEMNSFLPDQAELRCVRSKSFLWALFLSMIVPFTSAQIIITDQLIMELPDLSLQPEMPNQSFDLFVQNNGGNFPVTGISFQLQVADGGPENPLGSIDGPTISGGSVTSGTIFASPNNDGERGGQIVPQVFSLETLTPSGTVDLPSGSSKFATVTFDTTGFGPGTTVSYTLNTVNGPTRYLTQDPDFPDVQPTLIDGTLTVIPEPSHYAAIAGILCFCWAGLKRYKLRTSA